MEEAVYFEHLAAEHTLLGSASVDVARVAMNEKLAADYRRLADLLRQARVLSRASEAQLEHVILNCSCPHDAHDGVHAEPRAMTGAEGPDPRRFRLQPRTDAITTIGTGRLDELG